MSLQFKVDEILKSLGCTFDNLYMCWEYFHKVLPVNDYNVIESMKAVRACMPFGEKILIVFALIGVGSLDNLCKNAAKEVKNAAKAR